jgi:hypothetical protein
LSRLHRLALVLVLAGCARAAKPTHDQPLQAEAGVPVLFGAPDAPELTWDFGDGTAPRRGRQVAHAFARAGQYEVRGLRGASPFERVQVAVVPRPVLHAIPPQSEGVLVVSRTRGTLEPAVDFFERALSGVASGLAEKQPFARYALELSAGPPPSELGLDEDEGLASFVLTDPPALVAAVGIQDAQKALGFVRRQVAGQGMRVLRADPDALLLEEPTKGAQLFALVDRGYLYLTRLEDPAAAAEVVARLEQVIRAAPPEGMARDQTLHDLLDRVFEGQAFVFLPRLSAAPSRSALVSLRFSAETLELDGVLHQGAPLWTEERAPELPLLEAVPEAPVAALTVSVPPEELAGFLLHAGAAGKDERAATLELARVLTGDGWAAAWLDAQGTARKMASREGAPDVAGTLWAELGIRDRKAATLLVDELLQRADLRYAIRNVGGVAHFDVRHEAWTGRVEVHPARVVVKVGEPPARRRVVPLADALRARSFPGAFGAQRMSLALDFGQLLRELDAPPEDGAAGAREAMMRGLLSAFLSQASAVDAVMVDVAADPVGARLRARVTLR